MTQTKEAKEKTMRAVALDRFGGPETLKVQTVPIPEAGADEILIHVESAGVGAWIHSNAKAGSWKCEAGPFEVHIV